jgi:hypothetical protein
MYSIQQIKRFSHSADKDAIGESVNEHFDPRGPLALDIPLAVPRLISRGIGVFMTHRSRINQNYLILWNITF